jgi:hypothetical protein
MGWRLADYYSTEIIHMIGQVPPALIEDMVRTRLTQAIVFPDTVDHFTDRKSMRYWGMSFPAAAQNSVTEIIGLYKDFCGFDSDEAYDRYRTFMQIAYASESVGKGLDSSIADPHVGMKGQWGQRERSRGTRIVSKHDRAELAAAIRDEDVRQSSNVADLEAKYANLGDDALMDAMATAST